MVNFDIFGQMVYIQRELFSKIFESILNKFPISPLSVHFSIEETNDERQHLLKLIQVSIS